MSGQDDARVEVIQADEDMASELLHNIFGATYANSSSNVSEIGRYFARHRIASAATARGEGWQPIETAPRVGRIIIWSPLYGGWPVFARWDEDSYAKKPRPFWNTDTSRSDGLLALRERPPTHWMPLPAPPARDEGGL